MTPIFYLSQLHRINAYLDATDVDIKKLRRDLTSLEGSLPALERELADAERVWTEESARIEDAKTQTKAARDAARDHFHREYLQNKRMDCVRDELLFVKTLSGLDPKKPSYNPEKAAAMEAWEKAEADYQRVRNESASNKTVALIRNRIYEVNSQVRELQTEIHDAETQLANAVAALPEGASTMKREELEEAADFSLDICNPEYLKEWWPEASDAKLAGMIRGELPIVCPGCKDGYIILETLSGPLQAFVLDDEVRHPLCAHASKWDKSQLQGLVPSSHSQYRVHSLATWSRSPIPEDKQRKPMAKIPSRAEDVRGWIMSGPAGTSKTTYAAAAVTDMLTFRIIGSSDWNGTYFGRYHDRG